MGSQKTTEILIKELSPGELPERSNGMEGVHVSDIRGEPIGCRQIGTLKKSILKSVLYFSVISAVMINSPWVDS